MELNEVRLEYEAGRLKEAIIEPSGAGNGWVLMFKEENDEIVRLTTHGGTDRLFKSLDAATKMAADIGFKEAHVEERF
jgi:hypothetical protein